MGSATIDTLIARRQLDRILSSPGFARNERLARFLTFVVDRHLQGRDSEIKESVLAVEVFGRSADHDPRQDSIVRTEASRLRARLTEYYLGEGRNDSLVIELPKGGYVPSLHTIDASEEPPTEEEKPVKTAPPRWRIAALAIGVLAAAAAIVSISWRQNTALTVAVLPLINLSQDPAHDFFADGMTGELIRDLSILDGLVVRSQTSSFALKDKHLSVHDAAAELHVDYLLEGSVLRLDHRLRINTQLVRVRDDSTIWSGQYERDLSDVFAVQDEISRGIVNSLRLKLGRGRRRYEISLKAYDLYLEARAMEVRNPGGGENHNVGLYEQAIATDPSFAPAYAALAAAYAYRTGEDRMNAWATADRTDEIQRMHTVAAKALELDPLLAEAHAALGMVKARDGSWQDAEASFRYAIQLEPSLSVARKDYVLSILWPLGRLEESLKQLTLAENNDPLAPDLRRMLSEVLFARKSYAEAARYCGAPCPRAMLLQGKFAEAIPVLEDQFRGRWNATGSSMLGRAYALAGRKEESESVAAAQPRPGEKAEIFLALGDRNRALDALERAAASGIGPVRMGRIFERPELAALVGDPRVQTMRQRIGLPVQHPR